MKKLTIMSLIILLLIAIIPFFAIIKGKPNLIINNTQNQTTPDEIIPPELTEQELDYIACNTMMYIENTNHSESKKALIALCKNNYMYERDNELPLKELNIENYSDDFLNELKEIIKEDSTELRYNQKRVYIPIAKISAGYTATNDEYPYMESVASPWDVFHEDFDKNQNFQYGISVAGIDYLSNKGFDYRESLCWYLPNFTINKEEKAP